MAKEDLKRFLAGKPNVVRDAYTKMLVKAINSNDPVKIEQAEEQLTRGRAGEENRQKITWEGWIWKALNIVIPLFCICWLADFSSIRTNFPLLGEIIRPICYYYVYKVVTLKGGGPSSGGAPYDDLKLTSVD